jgi:hypothetical protein
VIDDASTTSTSILHRIINTSQSHPHLLTSNSTIVRTRDAGELLVPKLGIAEFDLKQPRVKSLLGQFDVFNQQDLASLDSIYSDISFSQKAQLNFGNAACFPIHVDSDASNLLDRRKLSAILYLNTIPPEVGGQLVLYPSMTSPPIIIQPKFNRMVLFSTRDMLHRVIPLKQGYRVCLTTWISGDWLGGDKEIYDSVKFMRMKLRYKREWRESIEESHGPSIERDRLLAEFDRDIRTIMSRLNLLLP